MTTQKQLEKLKSALTAMPHACLIEAVFNYASVDDDFMCHLTAIITMSDSSTKANTLPKVMDRIDRVFGIKAISGTLIWNERVRFTHVINLIETMLKHELYNEVVLAAERCFGHLENLAQVHSPDDFLEFYIPVIEYWILALRNSNVATASIAERLSHLEKSDRYGAFFNLQNRFEDVLGSDILAALNSANAAQ